MTRALEGLNILVPESRELDLFVRMLESESAMALRCPLVQILDLNDTAEAEAWCEALIAGSFDDVIWLTGEGLRRLLVIAERRARRDAFAAALAHVRNITRGPKPAKALRELGLTPGLAAATPTSQGVLDALAEENVSGRRIGVQLYPGDGAQSMVTQLRARGAVITAITPYRYAAQTETAQVGEAVRDLIAGKIDMVAFTSTSQVERLFEVAHDIGLEAEFRAAFARISVAAVGPVVEETLRRHGATRIVQPDTSFHLKPLLRAIGAAWSTR